MDFGEILNKWEKQSPGHGAYQKDSGPAEPKNLAKERRSRLLRKKPDASIDLHGLSRDEAWTALETFFENSRRNGFEKLQIIHGKGNHRGSGNEAPDSRGQFFFDDAGNDGALKELSRRFIENCAFAGESGYSSARDGGSGATWVILKERDR